MRGLPDADELVGDVSGLTAIVTGPTSGIGEATAAALVRGGAHGESSERRSRGARALCINHRDT